MFDKINCKPATTLKQEKWNIQFVTSVDRDIEKSESLTGIKPMTFCVLASGTLTTEKPIARLIGQLRRVIILLPNISVRQNSPSSGAVKAK